ncbi:MAG: hypothetical protein INR69_16235 [Mucilaginibacter polytrichastri]|nr:hypothetical protein [Mucilaginibacter polytrichastri]
MLYQTSLRSPELNRKMREYRQNRLIQLLYIISCILMAVGVPYIFYTIL